MATTPRPESTPTPTSRCYDCGKEHTTREAELIDLIWERELTKAEEAELNAFTEANHPDCFQ